METVTEKEERRERCFLVGIDTGEYDADASIEELRERSEERR